MNQTRILLIKLIHFTLFDLIYGVTFAKNNKYIKMIRLQNINLTSPEAIQRLANNHAIAVNLRDAFPYPYTIEDAITVCYVNFQN